MTSLAPPIRSSKRKRAQVTYYEADSDNEEDDDHESDFSNEALAGPSKVWTYSTSHLLPEAI